jgi:hypothetical protein
VTVASCWPHEIETYICRPIEAAVTGQYGSTTEKQFRRDPSTRQFFLGVGRPRGEPPPGYPDPPPTIRMKRKDGSFCLYALTHGVDAAWWEEWVEQNKDTEMVRNLVVRAAPTDDELRAAIKENPEIRSGFEPVDPENDPRMPRSMNPQVGRIEIAPRDS